MADAALYKVITDNVVTLSREAGGDNDFETTFDLPSTLDASVRSVLMIARWRSCLFSPSEIMTLL